MPLKKTTVAAFRTAVASGNVIVTVLAVVSAVVMFAWRIATCFVPAALLMSASLVYVLKPLSVALIGVAELPFCAAITKIVLFTGTALAASVTWSVPTAAEPLPEPARVGAVPRPCHVNVFESTAELLPARSIVFAWIR